MRARFPTMAGVDAMQLKTLLRRSTLSREDRQIAVCLLQWDMNYIDVGAKAAGEAVQALCADAGDAGRIQQMNQAGGFACLIHLCCCSYM